MRLAWVGYVTLHDSLSRTIRPAPWRVGDAVVGRGMLDGQHQRVDISAHARTAHKSLLQKGLEEDRSVVWFYVGFHRGGTERKRIYSESSLICPPDDPLGKGTELS